MIYVYKLLYLLLLGACWIDLPIKGVLSLRFCDHLAALEVQLVQGHEPHISYRKLNGQPSAGPAGFHCLCGLVLSLAPERLQSAGRPGFLARKAFKVDLVNKDRSIGWCQSLHGFSLSGAAASPACNYPLVVGHRANRSISPFS